MSAKKVAAKPAKKVVKPMVKRLFTNQAAWRAWLSKHHGDPEGIWVHFAKKGSGAVTVTYDEALETALCFGWIDAQVKTHDEKTFVRKFTPRRARSIWSKINRTKAERLMASGAMQPAGLRAIDLAREGGQWDSAYDSARTATVASDFQAALGTHKRAAAFFAGIDGANRYAILWRIQTARNAVMRAARIADIIEMLNHGKTFHPRTSK
jgi:uncharacterized protein YdeI (YjbR/CyaY-like superfamily)